MPQIVSRPRKFSTGSFAGALAALAALLGLAAPSEAVAQASAYPNKPVRILTGYPPGGPTDIIGRVLGDHLGKALSQPFYVEGKPGLAGNVAGGILATSPPDGYTLYIVGLGLIAVNADLYKNMGYDPATAFAPITLLVDLPIVLEVNAKLPVNSYDEFVKYAKSGVALNHGSPGIGTLPHLAAELFKSKIGFQSTHIAYRGTGPFSNAMMQGEVQWSFDVPNTAITLSKNGFVKLLAVTSAQPYPPFPGVPTMAQLGQSDMTATTWFGLVAPAGTPKEIIGKLHDEIARGWKIPEVAARLSNAGLDPMTTTPEETAKIFAADRAKWGAVVRANHITAE